MKIYQQKSRKKKEYMNYYRLFIGQESNMNCFTDLLQINLYTKKELTTKNKKQAMMMQLCEA